MAKRHIKLEFEYAAALSLGRSEHEKDVVEEHVRPLQDIDFWQHILTNPREMSLAKKWVLASSADGVCQWTSDKETVNNQTQSMEIIAGELRALADKKVKEDGLSVTFSETAIFHMGGGKKIEVKPKILKL